MSTDTPQRSTRRRWNKRRSRSHGNLSHFSDEECFEQENKELLKSPICSNLSAKERSPFTPLQNVVLSMRQRLEKQAFGTPQSTMEDSQNPSPGLLKLRMTPGHQLKEKQKMLEKRHEQIRGQCDKLSVGGGVSIWPEMHNMRLTRAEVTHLAISAGLLLVLTVLLFNKIHGGLFVKLLHYKTALLEFNADHPLDISESNGTFKQSVLLWHSAFMRLMDELSGEMTVSLAKTSMLYKLCVGLYVLAICLLLYYLADNILAKSKLTPRRIKIWVLLLVVTGSWTVLVLQLLVLAQAVERAVETAVLQYSDNLAALVLVDVDLSTFESVLLYWRSRCLPPTTHGTLSVLGLVAVRDVAFYLAYYCWPVATALLTPVVKLVVSLHELYSGGDAQAPAAVKSA